MLSLLGGLAEQIGAFVLNAIIAAINLVIFAIGGLIGLLMLALPPMPPVPQPPDEGILNTFAFFVPVGAIATTLAAFAALYIVVLAVRIALRWVKAL